MNDDSLRAALRRVDPAPPTVPVDRADSDRARALVEKTMTAPVHPLDESTAPAAPRAWWQRRPAAFAAAAALAAVATAGVALSVNDDDGDGGSKTAAAAPLVLTAPDGNAMASCMQFDEKILADMTTAFAGTVTSTTDNTVVIDVDRWWRSTGERPDRVELRTLGASSVALDGTEFTEGTRYLVTAAEGNVNGCGYSGPATPEYEASFERAFAG